MSFLDLVKMVTAGIGSYLFVVFILRLSGKRTLSKMNAFDFIVTVALGSVLANVLVNYETLFWEGITAFALLVGLQFVSTWFSVRSKTIRSLIKSEPTLLYFKGEYDLEALKSERVTETEIRQAIRKEGTLLLEDVAAVILESDGTLTVMQKANTKEIERDDFTFTN